MAQKRILKRDASTGRVSEGVSTDTYFSADPSVSSDLTTKNYADAHLAGQGMSAGSSAGQLPIFNGTSWVPGDPLVQGLVAAGASLASINPVYVGGVDGAGNSKGLVLDSSGRPTVNVNGTVPISQQSPQITGFVPDPSNAFPNGSTLSPQIDVGGALITRSLVLVDEGSFRDDFTGSSLAPTLTGTVTFNGTTTVTGSGTAFTTEVELGYWIKLSGDPEADYAVVASVDSDTQLTLVSSYIGTVGSGVAQAGLWATKTPAGGSISVSSSLVNIASGVASGGVCGIMAGRSDYMPLVCEFSLSVSQAIVNQEIIVGLQDVFGTGAQEQVVVKLSGTDPTVGSFVSAVSSAAAEIETTPFAFPSTGDFLSNHKYRICISGNRVELSVDDVVVATHSSHLPGPYTSLTPVIYTHNIGVPASSTTIAAHFVFFSDVDRIQIDNQFDESAPTFITGPRENNVPATVTPYNALRTAQEATQLFYDTFDSTLDTTERWTATAGSGGTVPSSGGLDAGAISLVPGTTVNGFAQLQSKTTFPLTLPGYLKSHWSINLDFPTTTNNYRFWGLANTLVAPTLTTPLVDAVGFEVGTDGKLYAVCYAGTGGTTTQRNQIADLSSSGSNQQPTDVHAHIYYTWFAGFTAFWAIDTLGNVVASIATGALGPDNNTMAMTAISISNGTSGALTINGCSLGDTGRNNVVISDGTYQWRKVTVAEAGVAADSGDNALVVGLSPTSPLPAGTNVLGHVVVDNTTLGTKDTSDMTGTTPGTAPANTGIVGGIYNSAAPTFTNGQTGPLQFDVNGNLKVLSSGTSGGTSSNFGSVFPASGTAAGAEYNLAAPTYADGNMVPLQTDSHGVLKVNVSSVGGTFTSASDGVTGAAVPGDAAYIGINVAGNLVGISGANPLPVTGTVSVNAIPTGSNVIGQVEILGSAGATLDGIVNGTAPANVLQVGGATITANPTYTTAKINPLSLTISGGVRTDITSVAGTAMTAVPSTFATAPSGSVQGVNASIFAGTASVPSGTFGTNPTAVAGTLPVNASLFIGTTAIVTTGTAGQIKVGVSGATGVTLDAVLGAAKPANVLQVGGNDGTNAYGIPLASGGASVVVSGTVAVTGGGGTQFADNVASGSTPTGTLAMGWDSANSKIRALKVDASQNLNVNIAASTLTDPAECTIGATTPPSHVLIVGGRSADVTEVFNPIPLAAGSASVVISGAVTQSGNWTARIVGGAGATLDTTKGTQITAALSTQDMKDSGRTYVVLSAALITGVTSEALATFTKNVGGTNTTAQTAYTINSGKTFRIQSLYVAIANSTAVANNCIYNVRAAGSVSASSPVVMSCAAAAAAAVSGVKGFFALSIPDGIDIPGNGTIQIGVSHLENVTTASISSFTLTGYEY